VIVTMTQDPAVLFHALKEACLLIAEDGICPQTHYDKGWPNCPGGGDRRSPECDRETDAGCFIDYFIEKAEGWRVKLATLPSST